MNNNAVAVFAEWGRMVRTIDAKGSAHPASRWNRRRATAGRTTRPRGPRRQAAVLVEFAIVFPILFLAIIGIIEFGRAVMVQQIVTNAAREGARRAIVPEATNDDVTTLVDNYLVATGLGAANRQITLLDGAGQALDLTDANSHDPIMVRVTVPYSEVGFGIYTYFAESTMGAVVQMRKE